MFVRHRLLVLEAAVAVAMVVVVFRAMEEEVVCVSEAFNLLVEEGAANKTLHLNHAHSTVHGRLHRC